MRILIDKVVQPQIVAKLAGVKSMEQYKFSGYRQDQLILEAPSRDVVLNVAIDIARVGARVEAYEYYVEIPNANLNDNLPSGLSYETYFDDQQPPVEQTRTWADLDELAANQAATATLRYFQPANNGEFLFDDIEIIQEAGFEVFGIQSMQVKFNAEYEDTGAPEYVALETIEWIDQNWRYGGYFDFVHAWLRMQEIYEAKGIDDDARWTASTAAEKQVLVRWNQVGLAKAQTIVPGSWSEGRTAKELNRAYNEFEENANHVMKERAERYYRYINFSLTNAGRTKFDTDWDWNNYYDYVARHLRFYELGTTNALIDWHDTVLATYVDADYVGSIPAATINNTLRSVLADKEYLI